MSQCSFYVSLYTFLRLNLCRTSTQYLTEICYPDPVRVFFNTIFIPIFPSKPKNCDSQKLNYLTSHLNSYKSWNRNDCVPNFIDKIFLNWRWEKNIDTFSILYQIHLNHRKKRWKSIKFFWKSLVLEVT